MGFAILLLYLTLSWVYPAEVFPELAPFRITFVVGVIGLVVVGLFSMLRRTTPCKSPQLWQLIAFTGALGISTAVAESWLGAPIMTLQRFGPSLTMFILAVWTIDSLRKLRIAVYWVALMSLIVLMQGAAAFHFGYNTRMFVYDRDLEGLEEDAPEEAVEEAIDPETELEFEDPNNSVGRIRGLGVLNDPNDLAMAFVVMLALLTGLWQAKMAFRNFLLVVLPGVSLAYGVYLTRSRGGTLALIVTTWLLFAKRAGRLGSALLLIGLVASAVALDFGGGRSIFSAADESAQGRITAWTEGLEMLKAHPFLGVGYGQFFDNYTLAAHNSFIHCFAEAGLFGYFFWIGLIITTLVQLHKLKQLPDTDALGCGIRNWAATLELAFVGFLSAAFFLSRTYVPMLYLLLGLSVALVVMSREQGRPVWSPSWATLAVLILGCELASVVAIYLIVKIQVA